MLRTIEVDESKLKVDIVVPGRFHAFAVASALLEQGHDVVVYTNYPRFVVSRFGLKVENVRAFSLHGIAARVATKLEPIVGKQFFEAPLHRLFGQWAASSIRQDANIVYGFSGVMEEILRKPRSDPRQQRTLVRGSSHIETQAEILQALEQRVGCALERPSEWMISRENREYELADLIYILSSFAHTSFIQRGFKPARLCTTPLGVTLEQFRPAEDVITARQERIRSGNTIRVLMTGTFSFRKGADDLLQIARTLQDRMSFRFVGSVADETNELLNEAVKYIDMHPRVPEAALIEHYAWADLFIFPTFEDGFAAVLLQAHAAALPVIATSNCAAPDFVKPGFTGWLLPSGDIGGFIEKLRWCDNHREALACMVAHAKETVCPTWHALAEQITDQYQRFISEEIIRNHE